MTDHIVTNGVTLHGRAVDVEIRDGRIDRILPGGEGNPNSFDESRRFDANGRLVTPALTEVHTHLDAALTAGMHRRNESGTLEESWEIWEEMRDSITKSGIKDRARKTVEWFLAHGVTRVRTHVGVENPTAVDTILELREEMSEVVDIQVVGFVSDFVRDETAHSQLLDAIDRGVDVVGGMPHGEPTRELGVTHVETVVDIAETHGLPLDLHIDETDDPNSRFTEVLAAEALDRGIGERTTASHATAMHSYPNSYADKVCRLLARSGVSVVTNPLVNAVLQGRFDDYPRRRGHTRIDELRDHGVTVGIGQDDVIDTAYAYGDGDPLKAAYLLLHFAHLNAYADLPALWEMLVEGNAEIYGMDTEEYGLHEGADGSLVVFDAPDGYNALRTLAPRNLVLKEGVPVAESKRHVSVGIGDDRHQVELEHRP